MVIIIFPLVLLAHLANVISHYLVDHKYCEEKHNFLLP